eukprot:CAMPEP_0182442420 /NCGR_PEP_ID=MMETSP1172-20130603/1344_1 /TAXON_ID=708627 /ORGANISM="Timspurckia oligopyrenoides, Strain CCMP3278" /LENGTH=971 /DNA_ID=CAMNT_0024637275 /DNA_START=37 /DNA_END=2949 /DNA_ORIENTATION=+
MSKGGVQSGFTLDGGSFHFSPTLALNPEHIELEIQLDIPNHGFLGHCTTTIRSQSENSELTRTIQFNAESFYSILNVNSSPIGIKSYSYSGHSLEINFNESIPNSDQEFISIQYIIFNPISGLSFSSSTSNQTPNFVVSDHETERARYWIPCIDHPSVRTTYSVEISVPSEYTALACGKLISSTPTTPKQFEIPTFPSTLVSNTEFQQISTKISQFKLNSSQILTQYLPEFTQKSVPNTDESFSSFKTENESKENEQWTCWRWELEEICPSYLFCIAVGDFVKAELKRASTRNDMELEVFAPKLWYDANTLHCSFDSTGEMVDWMFKKLGRKLPWNKYFQVATGSGIGGAMENISLVTWDDSLLVNESMRLERGWIMDSVNVHEMAHSYFGNAVVMKGFAHAWLKESWASFMEVVYAEEHSHEMADSYGILWMKREGYFTESNAKYKRPMCCYKFDSSWDMFDRHLYPGGAWRLNMLRHYLGENVFWKAVQKYLDQYWNETADTHDFQRVLEKHSNVSLEMFFNQWFYSPGHLKIKVQMEYNVIEKSVGIQIEQIQMKESEEIPCFDAEIEVCVEVCDGIWKKSKVSLSSKRYGGRGSVSFHNIECIPLQIVIDPYGKVLMEVEVDAIGCGTHMDLVSRMITRPLTHWSCLSGALILIKSKQSSSRYVTDLLRNAVMNDEFPWFIRRILSGMLGKIGTSYSIHTVCELIACVKDPRILIGLIEAIDSIPSNTKVVPTLVNFIVNSTSITPRSLALHALGKHGKYLESGTDESSDCVSIEVVESLLIAFALEDDDQAQKDEHRWWIWLKRGAVLGLGELKTKKCYEVLLLLCKLRTGRRAFRTSVIQALGKAVEYQEKKECEKVACILMCTLNDEFEEQYVRRSAAQALSGMCFSGVNGVVDALKVYKLNGCVNHDEGFVERLIRNVQKNSSESSKSGSEIHKNVEKLMNELRTTKDKVEALEMKLNQNNKV